MCVFVCIQMCVGVPFFVFVVFSIEYVPLCVFVSLASFTCSAVVIVQSISCPFVDCVWPFVCICVSRDSYFFWWLCVCVFACCTACVALFCVGVFGRVCF